jgi:hypothetical protein
MSGTPEDPVSHDDEEWAAEAANWGLTPTAAEALGEPTDEDED